MPLRKRQLVGFIEPCLPSPAKTTPSGPDLIHEIKHDGFHSALRLGTRSKLMRQSPEEPCVIPKWL